MLNFNQLIDLLIEQRGLRAIGPIHGDRLNRCALPQSKQLAGWVVRREITAEDYITNLRLPVNDNSYTSADTLRIRCDTAQINRNIGPSIFGRILEKRGCVRFIAVKLENIDIAIIVEISAYDTAPFFCIVKP